MYQNTQSQLEQRLRGHYSLFNNNPGKSRLLPLSMHEKIVKFKCIKLSHQQNRAINENLSKSTNDFNKETLTVSQFRKVKNLKTEPSLEKKQFFKEKQKFTQIKQNIEKIEVPVEIIIYNKNEKRIKTEPDSLSNNALQKISIERKKRESDLEEQMEEEFPGLKIQRERKKGILQKSSKGDTNQTQINNHKVTLNTSKYNLDDVILYDNVDNQAEIVKSFLTKSQQLSKDQKQVLSSWIHSLPQEQRSQIEIDKKFFPIPRNIDLKSIQKGLNLIYGIGKNRQLRPGEEALIIETIYKQIEQFKNNLAHLNTSINSVIQSILKQSSLEEITEFPFCMKQIELHWKLCATRLRYSEYVQSKRKQLERLIQVATTRGHFIDISKKENLLVQYLLQYSNVNSQNARFLPH